MQFSQVANTAADPCSLVREISAGRPVSLDDFAQHFRQLTSAPQRVEMSLKSSQTIWRIGYQKNCPNKVATPNHNQAFGISSSIQHVCFTSMLTVKRHKSALTSFSANGRWMTMKKYVDEQSPAPRPIKNQSSNRKVAAHPWFLEQAIQFPHGRNHFSGHPGHQEQVAAQAAVLVQFVGNLTFGS